MQVAKSGLNAAMEIKSIAVAKPCQAVTEHITTAKSDMTISIAAAELAGRSLAADM